MDLKNYQIPVKALLRDPRAAAVLEENFPDLLRHPMLRMAGNMPLWKVVNLSRGIIPEEKMNHVLRELEQL